MVVFRAYIDVDRHLAGCLKHLWAGSRADARGCVVCPSYDEENLVVNAQGYLPHFVVIKSRGLPGDTPGKAVAVPSSKKNAAVTPDLVRGPILFALAMVIAFALAACGTTPKKIEPPKSAGATTPKPGAYYLDDGPGDNGSVETFGT